MYVFTLSDFNSKHTVNVKCNKKNSANVIVISGNLIGSAIADYLPILHDLHTLSMIGFVYS